MEQRISLVTLGVGDLERARLFYERLGWKRAMFGVEGVAFFQAGGMALALYPRRDLAKDAGFNGINLLGGDRLSVVFNEKTGKNQTKLDVQGTQLTSDNLGIVKAGNTQLAGTTNFQNDSDLEAATKSLTGALTSLKSLSSTFGANLSVVQTRQDFTKDMANVLTTGADSLVNADLNQEAASLLALQTRQQLSQQALSLANQADQGVLRLLG